MEIIKKIRKEKTLNKIQAFISVFISVLFFLGLIPFTYSNIFEAILILIFIQMIISILRFREINVFLELLIILLSIISLIPILGFPIRVLGAIVSLFDLTIFSNNVFYQRIEINSVKNFNKRKQSKKHGKFNSKNIKNADFKEK